MAESGTLYDIDFVFAVLGRTTAELAFLRARLAQLEAKSSNGTVDDAPIPKEVETHA